MKIAASNGFLRAGALYAGLALCAVCPPASAMAATTRPDSNSFAGVGMVIGADHGAILIRCVIEGSPTDMAGLEPGCRVLSIDGASVAQDSLKDVAALLRGTAGSKVRATVQCPGERAPKDAVLTRARINTDPEVMFRSWLRSAQKGFADAQSQVALDWYYGRGTSVDYGEAFEWAKKAAAQNDAAGQRLLGVMYAQGQGVTQDAAQALAWFEKAAAQGDAYAQLDLGTIYTTGEGVLPDYVEAYRWLSLASAQGLEQAKASLAALAPKMTAEQIAQAQALAAGGPTAAPAAGAAPQSAPASPPAKPWWDQP